MASSTPDALWSSGAVRLLKPAAVACVGLRKRVGRRPILDSIDLQVAVGARVLVVGEPEAAASTLLRVLAGLTHANGGTVRIAGTSSPDGSASGWGRRLAYVGPEPGLPGWMSAREALQLSARLLGLDAEERAARLADAVQRWGLASGLDRPMRRNGLAYLQRTAMAAALVGDPEVVLLDEPLRAVNPDERIHLLRLPARRCTVLLASRYPASEAGAVNQVVLIRQGRVAVHAPISALEESGLSLSHTGIGRLADLANLAGGAVGDGSARGPRASA